MKPAAASHPTHVQAAREPPSKKAQKSWVSGGLWSGSNLCSSRSIGTGIASTGSLSCSLCRQPRSITTSPSFT